MLRVDLCDIVSGTFDIRLRGYDSGFLREIQQEISTILQEREEQVVETNERGVQTVISGGDNNGPEVTQDVRPLLLGGANISRGASLIARGSPRTLISHLVNPGNTEITVPPESERIVTFSEVHRGHPDFRDEISSDIRPAFLVDLLSENSSESENHNHQEAPIVSEEGEE